MATLLALGGLLSIGVGPSAADDSLVSIGDASIAEGNGAMRTMKFAVTLSDPASTRVVMRYSTDNGTAAAPTTSPSP